MRHVSAGELCAYRDGELAAETRERVAAHLAACSRCREELGRLEAIGGSVHTHLNVVTPARLPDAHRALSIFRSQQPATSNPQPFLRRLSTMKTRSTVWRPILVGAMILALFVGVFSFAPTRAIARDLLSIFRVRRFAVVQVNPDPARIEEVGRALEDTLFVGEPQVVADEKPQEVASIEEAREVAGFEVRMPGYLPGGEPKIEVKGRTEYVFTVKREGLAMLLRLAEMDPDQIPADFEQGEVRVSMPASVLISTSDGVGVMQALDPSVDYPEGIDPRLVGEAALRIMGLSPDDARNVTENIDWATTVLLPIPADVAEFREVEVAGAQGVILRPINRGNQREDSVLLFQKDDVVYVVARDRGGMEDLLQIGESLF